MSRKPPSVYGELLAPILTPLKTVMATRGDFPATGSDGIILLDELLIHTDEKGGRLIVRHTIEEAFNESGVDTLAEDTHSYRTADQRIHLVVARTILPDGRELQVDERAAFLESPQSDAADSVYGDRGQVRMIFSGMKPGVVREIIIVMEEEAPRIPGHFSAQETYVAYWPTRIQRTVLLLPDSVAARAKVTQIGSGTPSLVREPWRSGWQKWTWAKEKVAAFRYEGGRPPGDQSGPAVMVSTLPDWETFGAWYRGLLRERSTLDAPLKRLAREWTKDSRTPRDKLAEVIGHVSRDLRYTGLEFGLGALQPRPAHEVWNAGYGDCKDKSNLAVLLLRELGIEAHLVLLQTEHAGRVEKRSPDYRHFNHAILVAVIDGEKIFSDPTIRYGTPGMLSAPSSDRDVLIVKNDAIEWARTPAFADAEIHYHIDAALDPHGAIEGWLAMSSTGYFKASHRAYYERLGVDELRRDLQETLSDLLPGARLIDAEQKQGDRVWRCFFSLPTHEGDNTERRTLQFPAGDAVMLGVEKDQARETPRFLWPLRWKVSGRIALPEGWQTAEMPPAFDLTTEPYEVHAKWTVAKGECRPIYEAQVKQNLLQPSAHPAVWRGTQSLLAWLRKPLNLVRGAETAPVSGQPSALPNLPLMPTGEGQLTLVEQRYPNSGNRSLRRAALRKVMEYFPDDPPTLFNARARLALLDWDDKKFNEALISLQDLTASPSPKVPDETVWWARYMTGLVQVDNQKSEDALRTFESVIQHTSLSTFRRSWACFQAAAILAEQDQLEPALKRSREGLALNELASAPQLLGQCVTLLFRLQQQAELQETLAGFLKVHEADAAPALEHLASIAGTWAEEGHADWTLEVLDMLDSLPAEHRTDDVQKAIAESRAALAVVGVATDLQKDLKSFLLANPDLPVMLPPDNGWPATAELTLDAFHKAETEKNFDLASRLAIHSLTIFPPDANFAQLLWQAAAHLESYERNTKLPAPSALLEHLFKLGLKLPKSDDNYYEMRFLEGLAREFRRQDWKAAAAIYQELIADKSMPESFLVSAITRLAACQQSLRDWDGAISTLSKLKSLTNYGSAGDGLIHAAFLQLEMGHPDEAFRLLQPVAASREFAVKNSDAPEVLTEFLDLAKDEQGTRRYWQAAASWWDAWQKLQTSLGINDTTIEPLPADLDSTGEAIDLAIQNKDPAAAGPALRQIAHAARWLPTRTIHLARILTFKGYRLHPDQQQNMLTLVQTLLDPFEPVTEQERRARLMFLTISHMDRDRPKSAVDHVHEYFKAFPQDDHSISFVMARLWGSLSITLDGERPRAIAALEAVLDSKELRAERANVVVSLADIYRAAADHVRETSLLKAALEHPAIISEPKQAEFLQRRLDQLNLGSNYARAVKRWLSSHAPEWFAYAQPKDLKSLRAGDDLYGFIQETSDQRDPAENVKVYLLAAANEAASADQVDEWWSRGLSLMFLLQVVEEDRLRQSLDAIFDNPQAPLELKDSTVRIAYLHAGSLEAMDLLKYLRTKLAPAQLSAFSRDRMAIVDAVLAIEPGKPEALAGLVEAQVKKRDQDLLQFLISRLRDRAVNYGSLIMMEAISDALTEARKDPALDRGALQAMRLEMVRARTAVRRLLPVHNALAEVVLSAPLAQPSATLPPPRLIGSVTYPLLPSRQFMEWTHREMRAGRRPCADLQIWFGYFDACTEVSSDTTWSLRSKLVDAAVNAAADDDTRADVVSLVSSGCDIDAPEEREYLLQKLTPWRDPVGMPQTFARIRLVEAQIAQRLGREFDLQSLGQLKGADNEEHLADLRFDAALQSGDPAVIGPELDKMGSDAMLQSDKLVPIIGALRICGRSDELELALEAAEEQLYHAVLRSWTGVSPISVRRALSLAEALDRVEVLPDAWQKFVIQAYPERHDQLNVTMRLARLNKDWPQTLAAATEAVTKFPTFYSTYWFKAQALWELNRKKEALEPLQTYLQYCHNEPEYHQAQSLFKQNESHAGSQGGSR